MKIQCHEKSFGYKGNSRWWIIVQTGLAHDLGQQPLALKRLGRQIFVPQRARRLCPEEYEVVYTDKKYFENLRYEDIAEQVQNFAITLDNENSPAPENIMTYADRQKDKTGIGLSGNLGSGRAVYYGNNFNILGVGKTTLCQSEIPSHSTGRTDLMGAMRRVILSRWINYFTPRATAHPVLIALKETKKYKWNPNPIPSALLVRVDNGSLDRPSHVEYSPGIPINFQRTLMEYARLDAEYFAYRIMLGAWSTGNYSLDGLMIDLETASFVKYRGPYHTASAKHPQNLFGYEAGGFLKILHQLADAKNITAKEIENQFYEERRRHLGRCFLSLLGIADNRASDFFSKHEDCVTALSNQFEKLAKKINSQGVSLNLYMPISDNQDPSLLDMSNLFRNLANLYRFPSNAEEKALDYMIRKTALSQLEPGLIRATRQQAQNFIRSLLYLIAVLDSENCLGDLPDWDNRLRAINQDLPPMFELNGVLRNLAEAYRLRKINAEILGTEIEKLCELPYGKLMGKENVVKNLDKSYCLQPILS